ncbi:MAG TPA: sigma-70 family RNA polymerase sigma factor [Acidimicrobiia bacterium]|nr:sigma-70 family RNA polymerase sigma factor [Acidimicrobiia bacterium]
MLAEPLEVALADACRGDDAAVGVVYRALHPQLLRYLRHHVGPMAEDVASEVWLAIARRLPDFSGSIDEFRALLFTIARRRVVDHHRRQARQARTDALTGDHAAREDVGIEDAAVERLTAQGAIELLVRHLPPDQAEIVLLRVLAELDVWQVAEIVGKSKGAVRVAQHRALRRLQRIFEQERVRP